MSAQREPAIIRRHPAADLPSRPTATPRRVEPETPPEPAAPTADKVVESASDLSSKDEFSFPTPNQTRVSANALSSVGTNAEKFTEQHNVRIRPSTKLRLNRAVDKMRYETGDRSISIASLTDAALCEYLDKQGI
ncbi:hypothetical protein CH267_06680 [Rhodococcus sp. 06-621-2]|nr:hypothetical protein CH267_06680 [Rhodococcus sp. 06-621-2]